jgi:8-oxo-dGTP diphosphatase
MKLVTAAIILKNDTVLITRRKPDEKLPGYWEFPGGKIEKDETPQQCIERELFEELGIKSKAGKIIVESEYHYKHGSFRLLAILTTIEENSFFLKVHDMAEWAPLASLLTYNLAPADIPIAKAIMEKNGEL